MNYLFLLNHSEENREVKVPENSVDIITGNTYKAGETLMLVKKDVAILKSDL